MQRRLLKILIITTYISASLLAFSVYAQTQDSQYVPLEQLPGLSSTVNGKTTINLSEYLPNLVKLAIGLAAALSVIYIIIGGFKYISTDAIFDKKEGKETITNAVWGLLLAISSVVILNTISPKLLNVDLKIEPTKVEDLLPSTPATPVAGPSSGKAWGSDSIDRTNLSNLNIGINHQNCVKIGDTNCTSVFDIGARAITGLETIKKACKCDVLVTGGTEYWLHGNRSTEESSNNTQHKPGLNTVDLSLNSGVTQFLRANGAKTSGGGCSVGEEAYAFGRGIYVNEVIAGNPPHWHVCY